MLMLVHPGLLNKGHLINADILKLLQMRPHVIRRTNTTPLCRQRFLKINGRTFELLVARGTKRFKQIGTTGLVFAKTIQGTQCIAKKLKPFQTPGNRLGPVMVQGKTRHHADIRIDGVAYRHTLVTLDNVVILINPVPGFQWINKGEGQGTNPKSRRQLDGFPVRTGHPYGWMGFLNRFGDDVSTGHVKVFALESGIGIHRQHVADLPGGFQILFPFTVNRDVESPQFQNGRGFTRAKLHPAVGYQIQRGNTLRRARRMVVVGNHLADTVTQADVLRPLGSSRQKNFR